MLLNHIALGARMNRKQLVINVANVNNYNLFNNLGSEYKPGFTDIVVNVSGHIGSSSAALPSFTTGSGYRAGDSIKIINNGYIWGRGGAGGAGGATSSSMVFSGYTSTGSPGGAGGLALELLFNTSIVNNGQMAGGGKGGTGGSSMCTVSLNNGNAASPSWYSVGAAGGYGAGWPTNGLATGSPGTIGGGSSHQPSADGAAGAALGSGAYIKGNALAIWLTNGSRLGTVL